MSELLLELVIEISFEAALTFAIEFLGSLLLRSWGEIFDSWTSLKPASAVVGYVFLGAGLDAFSLLLFPHPIVHRCRIPGASLLLAPVLAGLGMSYVGLFRRNRNQTVVQIESFGTVLHSH